ncbi:MAG TPA: FHA domain-containing protein [Gemmatimonadaceae bacterium]|nr:FHA domain-containing protein [Gemmatimonadaceae bacterium]
MDAAVILIASAAVIILLTGVGVLVWWLRRDSHRGVPAHGPPFVLIPAHAEVPEIHPPTPGAASRNGVVERPPVVELEAGELMAVEPAPFAGVAERARPAAGTAPGTRRSRRTPPRPMPAPAPDDVGTTAAEPLNGTLRMLPGRLEVVSGLATRAEIRFVRLGTGDQVVTLGRQPGPPYEHVQLPSQTVSRRHAVMSYSRDGWSIANLSETNPLRVNGAELPPGADAVALRDGDLIELGEVQLRYRA